MRVILLRFSDVYILISQHGETLTDAHPHSTVLNANQQV